MNYANELGCYGEVRSCQCVESKTAEHLAGFPNVLDLEELATYKGILLYSELDRKFASLKLEV